MMVHAVRRTRRIQDPADEGLSWVPDLERHLDRFAAALERKPILECHIDAQNMDTFEWSLVLCMQLHDVTLLNCAI